MFYQQAVLGLLEVTDEHLPKSQAYIKKMVLGFNSWLMFAHLYP
jgi:hypothetical protein